MILADREIKEWLRSGVLVIEGIDPDGPAIQPASVDLTLGEGFLTPEGTPFAVDHVYVDGRHNLRPQSFALGTTLQYVKIPNNLVARVEGRSSLGRRGLCVHATAGFIDPGFEGHVTLELFNMSRRIITLTPGMGICQLAFETLSSPAERPYGSPGLGSKYQGQKGVTASRR